jgi:enoyl-CoA hydratase/carnithine racemase
MKKDSIFLLGAPLSERSSERLHSILGPHKAFDLILTGRVVKAKEAFECGIASRIVACGTGKFSN